jgi:hypothetical protein
MANLSPGQKGASLGCKATQGQLNKNAASNAFGAALAFYFFDDDLRFDFLAVFFLGTFFPAFRASESPIAIACLRLLTFLPERPLFKVPALRFFIARLTLAAAPLEYFRAMRFSPGCDGKIIITVGESSIFAVIAPHHHPHPEERSLGRVSKDEC